MIKLQNIIYSISKKIFRFFAFFVTDWKEIIELLRSEDRIQLKKLEEKRALQEKENAAYLDHLKANNLPLYTNDQ